MKEIILASASPRRKQILQQLGINFRVIPSNIREESIPSPGSPAETARKLAESKALDVASRVKEGLVLGADTIVVFKGKIFGKPSDDREAFEMLEKLSGRKHYVITGIALADALSGRIASDSEITAVYFTRLEKAEIMSYLASGEHRDKAGSYAIQGKGALFVDKVEGCFFNVVGLPIIKMKQLFKQFDVDILQT